MIESSYMTLYRNGELQKRAEKAAQLMASCHICPRECGVDRLNGELGYCKTGRKVKVASYSPHFGEESPLVGRNGSGTIFISSCNLLCIFCQNFDISHENEGYEVEPEHLATMMIQLSEKGCHNINFVTPTHAVPQILEGLIHAVEHGLRIPLVYNSSGYDKKETIALLDGIVDIYMPDFKFWDNKWAQRYCNAPDYREMAVNAIKEMHRQVGDLVLDDKGVAMRGLLVRHLVMPNHIASTEKIMSFLANDISPDTYVNVMDQYRPCGGAYRDGLINRRPTAKEFQDALKTAKKAGLKRLDPRDRMRFVLRI